VRPGEGGGGGGQRGVGVVEQRGVGVVEQRGEPLEDVRDLGPDPQLDRHVVLGRASGQSYGVVQQDLVRTDLDEQGREPRPASLSATSVATTSPPPAGSPANAASELGVPSASRA
jgi:hypothetical protein